MTLGSIDSSNVSTQLRQLQWGGGEACCVAMRFGKSGHEDRHEDIPAAEAAATIGLGAVFDAVRRATVSVGLVTAPMETINVSEISPGPQSPATPVKEPEHTESTIDEARRVVADERNRDLNDMLPEHELVRCISTLST
eukprot:COSAG06_NODE_616_length_13755_cov_32.672452_5_plen_139_part_00